ncbi:terminase small subunit-like protein [Phenylobacterium zucineum]|nr:hypothetical protein [Phenylobacterium zucineum]
MPAQHWFEGEGEWWPAVDHRAGFRETSCHEATCREILRRMARGMTIKEITADPDMPSYATLFHWVRTFAEFGEAYRALRAELAAERRERWEEKRQAKAFWGPHKARVLGRRWWRRGRPSSYTRAAGEAICARLARGEAMSAINADPAMPSSKVVYRWLRTEPEFARMVAEARAQQRRALKLKIHLASDLPIQGTTREMLARAKARVARLEGRLGRLTPKVWGRSEEEGLF